MYTVDLVRHGESMWVEKADKMKEPVFGVREPNDPLSKRGAEQAKAFGRYLRLQTWQPRAFLASPYRRTAQTYTRAMEAYGDATPHSFSTDGHFAELYWGDLEGQPRSIMKQPWFQAQLQQQGLSFTPPNGESFRDVRHRALVGLVNRLSAQPTGSRVVVFTHKNVIKSLVFRAMGWNAEQTFAANVGLLSMTRFTYTQGGGFTLEFFNRPTVVM